MSPLWLGLLLTLALSLRVTPASFFGPTTITVHVRAPLQKTDRKLIVLLDSESYGTSSEQTVDPEHPQPFWIFKFRNVPAGLYEVTAEIGDWSHVRAQDRVSIEIH